MTTQAGGAAYRCISYVTVLRYRLGRRSPAYQIEIMKKVKKRKKVCTCCGTKKWLSEFYKTPRGYVFSICKDCCSAKARERYAKKKAENTANKSPKVVMHDGRLMYISGRTWKLFWTENMLSIMRKHHANTSDRELGEMLGVSRQAVTKKAKEMGLKKSAEYKSEVAKRNGLIRRANRNRKQKLYGIHLQMD